MKFMRSVLILILFMIPLLLLSQDQDPKVKPADDENLVEVKTLQDLIQEKEIEEKKEPETKQEQTEKKEPVKDPEIKEQPKDEKKEPEIKEIKKEPADQKTSTKKPLKIPKQKESNPNIFNGKLSQEDILVEKKGNTHILWIKKKAQVFSAALISPSQWKIKGQYFLRSPKLIKEQKDNTLWYKGLPIGNNKKLYFLASSSTEKHPLLGKSFKIILPSKVTYGYDKKTGEKDIIPGKTYITIRLFKKPQGQGGSGDNLFLIPKIETKPITQPEVSIQQKQTKVHLFGISFVYHSLTPDIKRITLETDKEELLFHDFQKNLTYKKYFQIVQWGYNKDSKTFKMKFIMILNIKKNKNFVLKIKD